MRASGRSKKSGGPEPGPVWEHSGFHVEKRAHNAPPYKDCWHEYLAFEEDEIVGRISAIENPPGSRDCWINDLWVEREYRGKGVGSELLMAIMEDARIRSYRRLMGYLTPYDKVPMETVKRFYRGFGFDMVDDWENGLRPVAMLNLEPAEAALPKAG